MKISVIIPAFNAQKTTKALLVSLLRQDLPKNEFEIIVVDDGSQDNLKFKIENLKLKLKTENLIFLEQKHRGAGAARNLGVQKAKGEVFLFTDNDCLVPKNWVENHLKSHEKNKDIGIIGGGVKKPREGTYLAWADFLSSWFNAHQDLEKHWVKEYLPSLNLSVKREVFRKLGGFWERRLTGEDVDFCFRAQKKGIKILFEPSLALWHQGPTLRGFFKHHFNWGYHAPFVRGRQRDLAYHFLFSGGFLKSLFLFGPIVFGYILFLWFAWWCYQPFRFLICLPLIFLGKLVYGFGFLAGSWQKTLKRGNDY